MDMKRRLARGVSVLAIALAAGHLVQNMKSEPQAVAATEARPTSIQPVAAGPEKPVSRPVIASTGGAGTELAALTGVCAFGCPNACPCCCPRTNGACTNCACANRPCRRAGRLRRDP
jgi:hypothetical protein